LNLPLKKMVCDTHRTIQQGKETGQWLCVMLFMLNGTKFSAQEFRDALLLHYARTPGDLPLHCDGCGGSFSICHILVCKVGSLVTLWHNKINQELSDLVTKAMAPSAVCVKLMIQTRHSAEEAKAKATKKPKVQRLLRTGDKDRGDLLIRGFWARGTDAIVDVRVTDTDAKSYCSPNPHKVLAQQERKKKKKYLTACLEQRRHFTPFVVSTEMMA
jgi:hypothetical protein